jgi:hypothetical protein
MQNPANTSSAAVPTPYIEIVKVLDREAYGPQSHVAPSAKACLLVEPRPNTSCGAFLYECRELYWYLYTLDVGNTRIHISWEAGVWMIERTHPVTGELPQVLGFGSSLVVAPNAAVAAYLAKLCVPTPITPFEWISYH